jgi:hypothetical protein
MNLGEKIQQVIDNFEQGDKIRIFYTESIDNYSKIGQFVTPDVDHMHSYLKDYQEQGVVEGCDPKGVWFRFIEFSLEKKAKDVIWGEKWEKGKTNLDTV